MKVWITKYALTQGILEFDGAEVSDHCITMVTVPFPGGLNNQANFHGCEWHMRKCNAIITANKMRETKIRSLKKQLAKLDRLRFE